MIYFSDFSGGGGGGGPSFSDILFLSGFEGSDGSTTFTDESSYSRTMTASATAQIDTAQSKFGSSSLYLPVTNDRANVTDKTGMAFTGEFTLEAWVRFSTVPSTFGVLTYYYTSNDRSWALRQLNGNFGIVLSNDGISTNAIDAAWTPSTGVWYHVAADRDASDVVRVYIDGNIHASGSHSGTLFTSAQNVQVGCYRTGASQISLLGWIDEARISKVAHYAGSFTVPASAFPRS